MGLDMIYSQFLFFLFLFIDHHTVDLLLLEDFLLSLPFHRCLLLFMLCLFIIADFKAVYLGNVFLLRFLHQ